ncbi:MAG: hypothetical protein JO227_11145 [Acetobacteraceae bacterium]|nr:hypothetical protein [Acetobacteraceae bacterium]
MPSRDREQGEADAAFVEGFLRANPRWLAERPELYRVLVPPERVYGEHVADHMAAMIRAERAHAAAMTERADFVLAAGRAAASLAGRVQEAVLALLRSSDPMDWINGELPGILAVDAAHLCIEALYPGTRPLPEGTVARLLDGRQVLFRHIATDARLLHAEAAGLAGHDVLVLVPGEGPPALLALLARDEASLDPAQGTGALAFLGRAVAAALGR